MPLEIRELVIKATIDNDKGSQASGSSNVGNSSEAKRQIINQCVEKVLEILKAQKER